MRRHFNSKLHYLKRPSMHDEGERAENVFQFHKVSVDVWCLPLTGTDKLNQLLSIYKNKYINDTDNGSNLHCK